MYEINLKNTDKKLIVDRMGLDFLTNEGDIIDNLTLTFSGHAVCEKSWQDGDGGFIIETAFIYQLIAEEFLPRKFGVLSFKNGNKLDCRIDNLVYKTSRF